jgi:hypothetical protein
MDNLFLQRGASYSLIREIANGTGRNPIMPRSHFDAKSEWGAGKCHITLISRAVI